jgi:hypothetical protein
MQVNMKEVVIQDKTDICESGKKIRSCPFKNP